MYTFRPTIFDNPVFLAVAYNMYVFPRQICLLHSTGYLIESFLPANMFMFHNCIIFFSLLRQEIFSIQNPEPPWRNHEIWIQCNRTLFYGWFHFEPLFFFRDNYSNTRCRYVSVATCIWRRMFKKQSVSCSTTSCDNNYGSNWLCRQSRSSCTYFSIIV